MNSAQKEISTVYNSLSRENDIGLSASVAYDPSITGFRVLQTTDYVNFNLTGAPILQSIFPFSTGISNSSPSTGSNGTTGVILTANNSRRGFYIQNLGTGYLYLLFNTGIPSVNNFNVVLNPFGQTHSDWEDSYIRYSGIVSASGNGGLNVIAWNF